MELVDVEKGPSMRWEGTSRVPWPNGLFMRIPWALAADQSSNDHKLLLADAGPSVAPLTGHERASLGTDLTANLALFPTLKQFEWFPSAQMAQPLRNSPQTFCKSCKRTRFSSQTVVFYILDTERRIKTRHLQCPPPPISTKLSTSGVDLGLYTDSRVHTR